MPIYVNIMPNPFSTTGPLVCALLYDGLCTFEFGIVAEIFGLQRPEMGTGWYRFASCAIEEGPLRAHGGLMVTPTHDSQWIDAADLIVIPGWKSVDSAVPASLVERLLAAKARGARVASICSGAFVLAATGLLDGKQATTHWRYADRLAGDYPAIDVDPKVLFIDADGIFTSAGSAAGMDLLLHIVHSDFGPAAMNSVARRLVMPAQRNGGQAQFIEMSVPRTAPVRIAPLLDQMRSNLDAAWSIEVMAERCLMSRRTFLRRFHEATGSSPGRWLLQARIERAKHLLTETSSSLGDIADVIGFGSLDTMRHHFRQGVGISPGEYRQRFAAGCTRSQ